MLTLTASDFAKAWPRLLPAIATLEGDMLEDNYGAMVVIERSRLMRIPTTPSGAIVFERRLRPELWPEGKIYHVNARVKSYMSARDKKSTRLIVRDGQQQPGDFCWPGGIYKSGFGIGFSGLKPHYDELYCRVFLALAVAIAYEDSSRNPTIEPSEHFVGGMPPAWAED